MVQKHSHFASLCQVQYTSGGFKRFDLAEFKRLVTEQIAIPEKLGSMEGGCNMIHS